LVGAADHQDTHAGSDAEDLREFAKIQIRTAERIITMFWQKGRPEEAQWVYNTLLELSSPNVISTRLARSGSKILSENVSKGRWAEVEDIFARIACDKTRGFMALKAQAAYELALHHSETGNLPKALRYYDYIASQDDSLSLQFDPGNALCSLMSLCRRLGHTEEAEKRFWRYMESPGSAPSQQNSKAHCALKLIEHLSSSFSDPDCFRKALKIWDTLLSQADAVNLDKLKAGGLVFMVEGAALSGDTELALRLFEAFDSIEGASRAFPKAQTALALIRSLLSADRLADAERVYQAYRPMDLKESILKHQFAAAGAITGWLARRGQYRESARDICGGLLKIPPMSAFLGQQVELATRLLKLSVDAGNADHAGGCTACSRSCGPRPRSR
jgi:tetratricopeptide (TPR) repeat protein